MKKIIALVLVVILGLSLSACGKSEAVKNVETMIDALGEITLESIEAIRAAEEAYAALTPEEQEKVKNYQTLTTARDRYYELALVGEWCWSRVDLYDLTSNYDRVDMILNADMSGTDMIGTAHEYDAQWSVSNGSLKMEGEGYYNSFDVLEQEGKIIIQIPDTTIEYIMRDDFVSMLDDTFLIVDVADVDLSEYFGTVIYDYEVTDEWGDPSGYHFISAILSNRIYDQGWMYLNASDDFAIEILYPEFHEWTTYPDGDVWDHTTEAGSHTYTSDPFDFQSGFYIDEFDEAKEQTTTDLTADQISFGRAKGTIVFINNKYVSEVKPSEDGRTRILVTTVNNSEYYSGRWIEDMPY